MTDVSDRPSSRASSCSCRCSTTVRRCIAHSVRREVLTQKIRRPENRSRSQPIDSLLESGKVLALNFPVGMNPGLARILGVMLKLDFQRAILQRIPQITANPKRIWRDLLFVCDEYHAFATVGEVDPTGDERTFALSRQARLIPIVATQSISSLRSALPGDESWRTLAAMLPHEGLPRDQRRVHRQERGGAVRPARSTQGALQRVRVRQGCTHLASHGSADVGDAVVEREQELCTASRVHLCAARVHAAPECAGHRACRTTASTRSRRSTCYLKPHYLDVQTSYFDHLERGAI